MRKIYFYVLLPVLLLAGSAGSLCAQPVYFREEIDIPGDQFAVTSHLTTLDGGIGLLTHSYDISGNSYLSFIKMSATGAIQWTRRFGPHSLEIENIVQSPDSGYFFSAWEVIGYMHVVTKLDKNGNVVFSKSLSVPPQYYIVSAPIAFAKNDGGVYLVDNVIDMSNGQYAWHLTEMDAAGNLVFSKIYHLTLGKGYCSDVDTTTNGDILVIGAAIDNITGRYYSAILRTDSNGNTLWLKGYKIPGFSYYTPSFDLAPNDMIYVSGQGYSSASGFFATLMKVDGNGNEQWTFGYANNQQLTPQQTFFGANHDVIIAGEDFLLRCDTTGLPLCANRYSNLAVRSLDTLSGSVYTVQGLSSLTFRPVIFTAGVCGQTCLDSTISVSKSPLTVTDTILSGEQLLPLYDSLFNLIPVFATVHTIEVCTTVGIEEELSSPADIIIYPVPAHTRIEVSAQSMITDVELIDVSGKVIRKSSVNAYSHSMNIADLPEGVYLISVTCGDQRRIQKLIIHH